MKYSVFFVDDHPLVLAGLQAALKDISEIEVEVARTLTAARERLRRRPAPHLTLLDITLGDENVFDLLEELRGTRQSFSFAMLSSSRDWNHLKRAMRYGALGFLPKDGEPAALVCDIRAMLAGEKRFPNAELPPRSLSDDLLQAFHSLTRREKELLKHVKNGYLNREIAERMNVSIRTVESHRASAAEKLGVQGTLQLSAVVLELAALLDS